MIPDFNETIYAIETSLPDCNWLLRSDIAGYWAKEAGKTQYLCSITPKEWLSPSYDAWADSPSAAAFEAFNKALSAGAGVNHGH